MQIVTDKTHALKFFGSTAAANAVVKFSKEPVGPHFGDGYSIEPVRNIEGAWVGYFIVCVLDNNLFTRGYLGREDV